MSRVDVKYEELWEIGYRHAYKYYKEQGHLMVPAKFVMGEYRLGAWISTQRNARKKGTMSHERIVRLNQIGMIWDLYRYQWDEMYGAAKKYYESFGDLAIPLRYVTKDGKKLGSWISEQRKDYKAIKLCKKGNPLFTQDKIDLLNEIEMIWDNSKAVTSTSFQEQSILYYMYKAGIEVLSRELVFGVELDLYIPTHRIAIEYDGEAWHRSVNVDNRKNIICREQGIELIRIREPKCPVLNSTSKDYCLLGYTYAELSEIIKSIIFDYFKIIIDVDIERDFAEIIEQYAVYSRKSWKEHYEEARKYYFSNGNLQVPREYVENGINLGLWIHDLRKNMKKGTLPLSQKQINQLEQIGMIWDIYENTWDTMYEEAKEYFDKFGSLEVPKTYKCSVENNLYHWINEQRKKYVKNLLEQSKIDLLEKIGMVWTPISSRWDIMYGLAKQYYEKNGDLLVPIKTTIDGNSLGNWISVQRKKYNNPNEKTGKLSEEQIQRLDAIGMIWDAPEEEWLQMYKLCQEYHRIHGNLRVNRNYVIDGVKLGVWIGQQRVKFNRGDESISEERIQKLNNLGMVWDEMLQKWLDYYEIALQCYNENGHVNVVQKFVYKDKALGKWLYRQKYLLKENKLSELQKKLLVDIGVM